MCLQGTLATCGDFQLICAGVLGMDGSFVHKGGLSAACAESINAVILARLWPSLLKVL